MLLSKWIEMKKQKLYTSAFYLSFLIQVIFLSVPVLLPMLITSSQVNRWDNDHIHHSF
jgi:hypothetical protein